MKNYTLVSIIGLFALSCANDQEVDGRTRTLKSKADVEQTAQDPDLGNEPKASDGTKDQKSQQKSTLPEQANEDDPSEPSTEDAQEEEEELAQEDPQATPNEVVFTIDAAYDGTAPLNDPQNPIYLTLMPGNDKQVLKIVNNSAQTFRLHTGGAPCPHATRAQEIGQGESFTCEVTREVTFNPNNEAPTYDHNAGSQTSLYMTTAPKP